jgi:DNA-directed RNA polymerase subunit RPC12/RpoP
MAALHHICDECGSEFTLKYDETLVEDDPQLCPFCGEYILELDEIEDEDE